MRGLTARLAMAMHRVQLGLNGDAAEDHLIDADTRAEKQGIDDFRDGVSTMPELFKGETVLEEGWEEGQAYAKIASLEARGDIHFYI